MRLWWAGEAPEPPPTVPTVLMVGQVLRSLSRQPEAAAEVAMAGLDVPEVPAEVPVRTSTMVVAQE